MSTRNHAVVLMGAHILRCGKAHVLKYFAYLEGDSLTFPHPCVLHNCFLLSVYE